MSLALNFINMQSECQYDRWWLGWMHFLHLWQMSIIIFRAAGNSCMFYLPSGPASYTSDKKLNSPTPPSDAFTDPKIILVMFTHSTHSRTREYKINTTDDNAGKFNLLFLFILVAWLQYSFHLLFDKLSQRNLKALL